MSADLSGIRDELRAVARDLLAKAGREATLDWQLLAEAGWLGLEVPEPLDGAGASFAEAAVVVEEMGRVASRSSYLGGIVLGVGTLGVLEPSACRDEMLREAAAGALVPAAALAAGDDGLPRLGNLPFRIQRSPHGPRLHGSAAFVPDATDAGVLLLLAADPAGTPVIVAADPLTPGLSRTAQPVLDATRRLALVTADAVELSDAWVWRFRGDPDTAVRGLFDRAAVAVACDSLGLSEAMLDATVGYAQTRQQFGRPIGSFQAVKHACADMLVRLRVARELVADAVQRLSVTGGSDEAAVAASMAKSYACSAAVEVAGKAMQMHGGMGYTWESGIHVYLKRAALNRALFGSPAAHRRRLSARYRCWP
jgi:alkylation response protein AidB-like acyl-CoA dehydrogenase